LNHALSLESFFRLQIFKIASNPRYRSDAVACLEFDRAIQRIQIAFETNRTPMFGMAGIVDRCVIVLAPEEVNNFERNLVAEDVFGHGLSLAFCDDPMFYADLLIGVGSST